MPEFSATKIIQYNVEPSWRIKQVSWIEQSPFSDVVICEQTDLSEKAEAKMYSPHTYGEVHVLHL